MGPVRACGLARNERNLPARQVPSLRRRGVRTGAVTLHRGRRAGISRRAAQFGSASLGGVSKFSGPQFYKSRLFVVRKGAETGDTNIAHATLTAFENGYATGFSPAHDAPGGLHRRRSASR